MNSSILLIGALLLAVLILPFVLMIRHQKNKHKKEMQGFKSLAEQNGVHLNKTETINELIIGLDAAQKKLALGSTLSSSDKIRFIDLKDFSTCKVKKSAPHGDAYQWVHLELGSGGNKETLVFLEDNTDDLPKKDYYTCLKEAEVWKEELTSLMN